MNGRKRKEATQAAPTSSSSNGTSNKKRSETSSSSRYYDEDEHEHASSASVASSSSSSASSASSVSSSRSSSPDKTHTHRQRQRRGDAESGVARSSTSTSASSSSHTHSHSSASSTASSEDAAAANELHYRPRLDLLQEGDPGTLSGPPIRLYADGIFDLFHLGHAKALEQAKKLYPHTWLLVGCCSDAVTHEYKGITVMSEEERYESLRHCKWVDEVVEDAPWVVTDDFLQRHNIDYVCHDALPYVDTSGQASDGDVYSHLKKKGKFLETQRTDGISTSDIINRIIVHYDDYVLRQLQRGYSAKDMNVPQWKETTLLTKKYLHDVATTTTKTLGEIQHSFIDLFNRNSDLRCTLRKRRKETWNRVSTLFRTPFTATGATGATAAV